MSEWWTTSGSTVECGDAAPIIVSTDVSDIDFQLEEGQTISGFVTASDEVTPAVGTQVLVFLDSPNNSYLLYSRYNDRERLKALLTVVGKTCICKNTHILDVLMPA